MCGIVGIVSRGDVIPRLLEGLKRLEYRGYDSAGVAVVSEGGIVRRRAEGKLSNLQARLDVEPVSGVVGIGHTRWATHGRPGEGNAHPHSDGRVAVVHNGIIENYTILRAELEGKGCVFESDTDTETIVHLISHYWQGGVRPEEAVRLALSRLDGAFALAVVFSGQPGLMIVARRGSPLVIGDHEGDTFVGSDALALVHATRRLTYLDEGDWAVLRHDHMQVYNAEGQPVKRPVHVSSLTNAMIGKGRYSHFMLKEIFEQPQVIGDSLGAMFNPQTNAINLPGIDSVLEAQERVTIIACGTSYYAGLVARYWLESIARVAVDVEIASEFRYRDPVLREGGVVLFISQSGETADTLAALRYCRERRQKIISLVNVPESTMARESDVVLRTLAGPEIGVASTKAFTTQLVVLACLALSLARSRGCLAPERIAALGHALAQVPAYMAEVLGREQAIHRIAEDVAQARDILYLGRGANYPIALEGALKLKETSYIHAEGYAAGEMKHGPVALVDDRVPIIVLAPSGSLFEKMCSNIQEMAARGGRIIVFSDAPGVEKLESIARHSFVVPSVDAFVAPILYALPVQLLAYRVALLKGTDVDQPRNLAKSVTVE